MLGYIDLQDFSKLFGVPKDDFDEQTKRIISKTNFKFKKLSHIERDRVLLEIIKRIDSSKLLRAGKEGKDRWEKGWSENLRNFIEKGYNPAELIPKYVRPAQPVRLYRDYVIPLSSTFEIDFFTVLRSWLFNKYVKRFRTIYEFACGPGYNLYFLAKLFPDKELCGMDWSNASVDLVDLVGQKFNMNISGRLFDMFAPDGKFRLKQNSVAITIGGLEQLGRDFKPFIQYLVGKTPNLCIHVEPIYEMYEGENLADYLAMKFHARRNYLIGLLPYLKRLESENRIKIIKVQRAFFGSLFHDGWSIIVYKPVKLQKNI
ncbi:MAG: hypothetical protein ACT6FE_02880 [Methanosarcinaceae archaeon]